MSRSCLLLFIITLTLVVSQTLIADDLPALPENAQLAFEEDWSSGSISPRKWYALRKQWGASNNGVVPENVFVVKDTDRHVLQCVAHGDRYEGPIFGKLKNKQRVGGVLVSRQHFASGRFQVAMKIGTPEKPRPAGMVPAIWTYGFRSVKVDPLNSEKYLFGRPFYHPKLQKWGKGQSFYWSEIDFPEYGKDGKYDTPMYNTFLNSKHIPQTFDAHGAADGSWHTYTTDWRTHLVAIPEVKDADVVEKDGYYWIRNADIPFDKYWGNPLRKQGDNKYSVCSGKVVRHWIDGQFIGENTQFVPAMTGQLNLGVWLPKWAGVADWKTATVQFGDIKVWQFNDPGDVKGFLTEHIPNSFNRNGELIKN